MPTVTSIQCLFSLMIASTDADTLDWERCIICGEDRDLRCPADRPDGEGGALLSYDDFCRM